MRVDSDHERFIFDSIQTKAFGFTSAVWPFQDAHLLCAALMKNRERYENFDEATQLPGHHQNYERGKNLYRCHELSELLETVVEYVSGDAIETQIQEYLVDQPGNPPPETPEV